MLTAVLLYASIAAICAFAGAASYRHRMLEVFISDFIIAALGAWLGGMLAGTFGPAIAGIPLAAALGVAAPLVVLFNLLTVPLTEERLVERELPVAMAQPIGAIAEPIIAPVGEPIVAVVEPSAPNSVVAPVDIPLQPTDPAPALVLPGAAAAPTPLKPPVNDLPEVA